MRTQNRTPEISSHLAKQNSQINTAIELRLMIFCKPLMTPRYLQFFFSFFLQRKLFVYFPIIFCLSRLYVESNHNERYSERKFWLVFGQRRQSFFSYLPHLVLCSPALYKYLNQIWRPCNNAVNYHNINLWIKITDKRGDRSRSNNSARENMFSNLFTKYKNSWGYWDGGTFVM